MYSPSLQARRTKQHLETKWGVQFPNTGFCNFVKFSVIRHVRATPHRSSCDNTHRCVHACGSPLTARAFVQRPDGNTT
eukprot:scaffold5907_cov120-Isochrysis_galbana.AAC.9